MAHNPSVIPPVVQPHSTGTRPATLSRAVKCSRCGNLTPKPVTQPDPDATFLCGYCGAKLGW